MCLCAYTIWTCAAVGKTLKIGLKSIKIIKWLAGTASTCSILFCPSHGCSRQFWTQSKLNNASFSGERFTLSASFTFTTITDNLGKCTFKHGNLRQLDPFTNLAKGWTSQSIICQRSFKQLPLAISYKKFLDQKKKKDNGKNQVNYRKGRKNRGMNGSNCYMFFPKHSSTTRRPMTRTLESHSCSLSYTLFHCNFLGVWVLSTLILLLLMVFSINFGSTGKMFH